MAAHIVHTKNALQYDHNDVGNSRATWSFHFSCCPCIGSTLYNYHIYVLFCRNVGSVEGVFKDRCSTNRWTPFPLNIPVSRQCMSCPPQAGNPPKYTHPAALHGMPVRDWRLDIGVNVPPERGHLTFCVRHSDVHNKLHTAANASSAGCLTPMLLCLTPVLLFLLFLTVASCYLIHPVKCPTNKVAGNRLDTTQLPPGYHCLHRLPSVTRQ